MLTSSSRLLPSTFRLQGYLRRNGIAQGDQVGCHTAVIGAIISTGAHKVQPQAPSNSQLGDAEGGEANEEGGERLPCRAVQLSTGFQTHQALAPLPVPQAPAQSTARDATRCLPTSRM